MGTGEVQYSARTLPSWLDKFPEQVVLVKDDTIYGVFGSEEEANYAGTALFRFHSYLLKRVSAEHNEGDDVAVVIPE